MYCLLANSIIYVCLCMYFGFDRYVTQSIVVMLKPVLTRILLHFSYYRLFNLIFFSWAFCWQKRTSFHVTEESERVFVHWWGNNILKCMMAIETTQKRNSNKYNNTNHMPAGNFFFFSFSLFLLRLFLLLLMLLFWWSIFTSVFIRIWLK